MRPLFPLVLLLPAAGCVLDTGLGAKPDPPGFETGEPPDSPPVDTAGDSGAGETGETDSADTTPACPDQTWAEEPVTPLEACDLVGERVSTFDPDVLWTRASFAENPGSRECMMQPVVCSLSDDDGDGDADGDDIPDVVFVTWGNGNMLRAVSGADGSELWATPADASLMTSAGVACGDLDGDGNQEVVAASYSGVVAVDRSGGLLWSSEYCSRLPGNGAPGLADMDGDGSGEILLGGCVWDATGALVGTGDHGMGTSYFDWGSAGYAVDIDQDGDLEAVVGNALYDRDGNALWYNGESDGYTAVGDFDGDPYGEIVVVHAATMRIQDDDGSVICTSPIPGAVDEYGGPPTVADLDGDGVPEIGVSSQSTYNVFGPDCSVIWTSSVSDPSSGVAAASVFDFEGDGVAEIVYADEETLWIFDGEDGAVKLEETSHRSGTCVEYPTVADVNADGSADIVTCRNFGGYGVAVFTDAARSWRPAPRIWNQHAYSITNIDADGGLPTAMATNWLSHNNFRAGSASSGEGWPGPDLRPVLLDVCAEDCATGAVTVWIAVENLGESAVTEPFTVELWGEGDADPVLLATVDWTAAVPPGTRSASSSVELTGVASPVRDLVLRVDPSGGVQECDEGDNEARWGRAVCW